MREREGERERERSPDPILVDGRKRKGKNIFIFALPLFDLYLWVCDWERLVMESSDSVYGSL